MTHRTIQGLIAASRCAAPGFAKGGGRGRGKGPKSRGLKYERELGSALGPDWQHGCWFHYFDARGSGYCQTDFLRELEDCVVVLEAKLSWVPEGHTQLEGLYRPVVERTFGKPMVGLVVCRRLVPGCKGAIAHTLPSALAAARSCRNVVLHWACKAPLQPGPPTSRPTPRPLARAIASL